MIEKIHIIVALFAALAITILGLYQDVSFYELSKRLVIIIPVFYIFGLFFRSYLKKLFAPPVEPPKDENKEDAAFGEQETEIMNEDDLFDDNTDL